MRKMFWLGLLLIVILAITSLVWNRPVNVEGLLAERAAPVQPVVEETAGDNAAPVQPVAPARAERQITEDDCQAEFGDPGDNYRWEVTEQGLCDAVPVVRAESAPAAAAAVVVEEAAPREEVTFDSGESVNVEGYNGPLTREAQDAIGLSVVRVGTEAASWTWRGIPNSAMAVCPDGGWICTLHLVGDDVMVVEGDGSEYEILAGTFRFVAAYPRNDAVHDTCELLAKEQRFGQIEDPSFQVEAGNFSCTGQQVASSDDEPAAPADESDDEPAPVDNACPSSPEEAAELLGGNADGWTTRDEWNGNGWKYGGTENPAPATKITAPAFGVVNSPVGDLRDSDSATVSEATFWCEG